MQSKKLKRYESPPSNDSFSDLERTLLCMPNLSKAPANIIRHLLKAIENSRWGTRPMDLLRQIAKFQTNLHLAEPAIAAIFEQFKQDDAAAAAAAAAEESVNAIEEELGYAEKPLTIDDVLDQQHTVDGAILEADDDVQQTDELGYEYIDSFDDEEFESEDDDG